MHLKQLPMACALHLACCIPQEGLFNSLRSAGGAIGPINSCVSDRNRFKAEKNNTELHRISISDKTLNGRNAAHDKHHTGNQTINYASHDGDECRIVE